MIKPIIKFFCSIKLTVSCLSLLFILTFWGTVAQVNNGLYLAQERFFNSLFFLAGGFIPFPGARLVLWILFINLLFVACTRLVYKLSQIGIIITHIGLLLFFVSAFVTFHGAVESNVTLLEGAGTNVSTAYHQWELSIWAEANKKERTVVAFDATHFKPGQKLDFSEYGFSIVIEKYFQNSSAYTETDTPDMAEVQNALGIKMLKSESVEKEPEKNFPGVIFHVKGLKEETRVILYGGELQPTPFEKNDQRYSVMLRRKRLVLPFILKLKNFQKELHPNTQIARSYQSLVEITPPEGGTREVLISMNEPLRHKDFTLYQASYAVDQWGRELSTLAVVKNTGRLLPYVSSLTVCVGLFLHLIMMGRTRTKNK